MLKFYWVNFFLFLILKIAMVAVRLSLLHGILWNGLMVLGFLEMRFLIGERGLFSALTWFRLCLIESYWEIANWICFRLRCVWRSFMERVVYTARVHALDIFYRIGCFWLNYFLLSASMIIVSLVEALPFNARLLRVLLAGDVGACLLLSLMQESFFLLL